MYFSKKYNARVNVRYALAEKAGVDRQSIIDLEYDGLHSVGVDTAKRIISGLSSIQGIPIGDSEMLHLLADDHKTVLNKNDGCMARDRRRYL